MIKNNDTISPYQITMIVIMTIVGVGIFSLPAQLADTAGSDSWFVILIGGLLNLMPLNIILMINNRFPNKTLPEYAQDIVGKVPGKIITAIYAIYFIIFVAYEVRIINEVIKSSLLLRTPSEVIMLTMILTATYAVRGGVECVARVMEMFFPLLFIPLFLIMIPGIADLDLTNIMPVFYNLSSKILVSLPNMALSFAGYEVLMFYVGFMENPKKAYKSANIGIIFVTVLYMVIIILCLTMFGVTMLKDSIWPLLGYVRDIDLPDLFLERLDAVMLAIWLFTVYTTIVSLYFVVTYSISKILGTKEQKQFVLPLVPIIYYMALLPQNIVYLKEMENFLFQYLGIILIFLIPIVLLVIAWIRKVRGEVS
ncbi:GerAB/ArcD/ProY family transporter [Lutispora thermophila]|uniref:Spore germination protein n=1 Tax=Lutispora thermophila DSM 19022 TaxID=1122184 RepID=A0A1M6BUH2_9FIRM|nr:endospore germination permease [Lutispora thermophila]SHI52204.1 spore germination protein [Lutispora thermophila DSM 19022]